MRERHILRAWPLTPIHIGTGEELTPESFSLEGNRLRTFNSFAALAAATDAERTQYQNLLKGGDFVGAQNHLAKIAKRQAQGAGESVAVSDGSKKDLERVLKGLSIGAGRIRPFMRDGGKPILPGSSLKGAFRTAWIDRAMADSEKQSRARQPSNPNMTSREARDLNDLALDIEKRSALEQDPFRDLAVVDAAIPPGRTRYGRATLGNLDRQQAKLDSSGVGNIQMHVERLESLADGGAVASFEIAIDIAPAAFVDRRRSQGTRNGKLVVPRRPIGATALWSAANRFHADLWLYEHKRFYKDSPAGELLDRLLEAFGLKRDDSLTKQLDERGLVLLRVGRYGQFESKAARLDGRRYGVKAATNSRTSGRSPARFMAEGGARTTVKVAKDIAAPFGWLLLALPGKGPQENISARLDDLAGPPSGASRTPPSGTRAPAQPAASPRAFASQLRFAEGDKVEHNGYGEGTVLADVTLVAEELHVRFDDDDDDWFSVAGWKRK